MPKCARCRLPFDPADPAQRYCGKACKRAAAKQRRRAAGVECGKQRWTDEHAADLAAARFSREFGGQRWPYECEVPGCGWWHLTKMPPGAVLAAYDMKRVLFGTADR